MRQSIDQFKHGKKEIKWHSAMEKTFTVDTAKAFSYHRGFNKWGKLKSLKKNTQSFTVCLTSPQILTLREKNPSLYKLPSVWESVGMPSVKETLGQFLWDLKWEKKEKKITKNFVRTSAWMTLVLGTFCYLAYNLYKMKIKIIRSQFETDSN